MRKRASHGEHRLLSPTNSNDPGQSASAPFIVPLGRARLSRSRCSRPGRVYMMCTCRWFGRIRPPGNSRGLVSWQPGFATCSASTRKPQLFPCLVYLRYFRRRDALVHGGHFIPACAASAGPIKSPGGRILPRSSARDVAVMNLLLFSPRQYENFLYAIMGEVFTPACALVFALLVNLSNLSLKWKALVNGALAFIGTYTFANGMLLWVLAFPLEITPTVQPTRARIFWRMVYALIGAASVACYFLTYRHPPLAAVRLAARRLPACSTSLSDWICSTRRPGPLCGRLLCSRRPGGRGDFRSPRTVVSHYPAHPGMLPLISALSPRQARVRFFWPRCGTGNEGALHRRGGRRRVWQSETAHAHVTNCRASRNVSCNSPVFWSPLSKRSAASCTLSRRSGNIRCWSCGGARRFR
jgi:hypothetical protein